MSHTEQNPHHIPVFKYKFYTHPLLWLMQNFFSLVAHRPRTVAFFSYGFVCYLAGYISPFAQYCLCEITIFIDKSKAVHLIGI